MIGTDFEPCYRAVQSRDARFDGWFFTAVTSTGIYCRPSCPAMTPKAVNVRFYPTAAAAQAAGFRACRRCRPDATPGSPEWNDADLVGRDAPHRRRRGRHRGVAVRAGSATASGTSIGSDRAVGAGPIASRAQRFQSAFIETTSAPSRHSLRASEHPPVQRHDPTDLRDDAQRHARCSQGP
jgi:AraC family transcriptional regulator of adaptative response / DNA-3-methyladenine glycosylase II